MAVNMTPTEYRKLLKRTAGTQSGRNTRNRSEGEAFQARLDSYHTQLRLEGKALAYRTNPDIRLVSANRAVVTGKGPCDYFAFLADGRVVVFDAKSRTGNAFSINVADIGHQLTWLDTMQSYGHITGLLVWWKDYGECRWHPSDTFVKRVRLGDGILLEDVAWLPAIG